jgi:hypothetical protein
MSDTTAHYSALLTRIDLKISALVENPQVDYQVGGGNGTVRITASQKLDQLMKLRESILKRITSKPEEVIETLQTDFSAFGEDFNTYINEDI